MRWPRKWSLEVRLPLFPTGLPLRPRVWLEVHQLRSDNGVACRVNTVAVYREIVPYIVGICIRPMVQELVQMLVPVLVYRTEIYKTSNLDWKSSIEKDGSNLFLLTPISY